MSGAPPKAPAGPRLTAAGFVDEVAARHRGRTALRFPDEGVELPREASAVPGTETLLAAAAAALRARGRVQGLSYFTDALESVRPLYG